jgi:V8-like Glu-specific endopeptidase
MSKLLALFVFTLCAGPLAQALPLPKPGMSVDSFPATFTTDFNFEGIVGLSNCSGSLIRLENSKDGDQALILTNGHCLELGFPDPGEVIYGKPSSRGFKLFGANNQVVGRLNATQVVYSTMTKTDMTIYKLEETYAEIKTQFGVNALKLSAQHPAVSDPVEVISGYWSRGFRCNIETFVSQLKEADWTSEDSIRYSRPGCEVFGGTSGSPIIRTTDRAVVGVNNTGNESGRQCTMNNPCEVDKDGKVTAQKGYTYGQETYWVYSCLNQYNEIDLGVAGCLLPH